MSATQGTDDPQPRSPDRITSGADLAAELRRLVRTAERRLGRNIARAGLAKRIGVSTSSLYAYLNGTTLIPADTLFQLLRELKVDEQHARRMRQDRDALVEPAPAANIPKALPLDIDSFTGRAAHLAELDQLRSKARKTAAVIISAVSGMGGVGKTALAIHWAHLRRNRFPDGYLYLDLLGFHPDLPLQPAEALAALLRRLGVPGSNIPVNADERKQHYYELLAGKRILILLDNAFSSEQVRPLLPPGTSSCFVVITSRDRLTGLVITHNAHPLLVDVLSDGEARTLLAARLGAHRLEDEPDAVSDILAACGGLPLALSIVAGRARTLPNASLSELAAGLHDEANRLGVLDERDPTASLPAVLSWSLRVLTDEQALAFELLGLVPGPDISLAAAACLVGFAPTRASGILHALEQASLVERDSASRYRMHALVRLYARNQAARHRSEPERQMALLRVSDYYLHTAHAADHLINPHRVPIQLDSQTPGSRTDRIPDFTTALAWFEAEHSCVLAALQMASECGRFQTVWRLAWALNTFHLREAHYDRGIASWQAGLHAAEQLVDVNMRGRAHLLLGTALAQGGRFEEAMGNLLQALALAEQNDNHAEQAHIHQYLSWVWGRRGDDRRALVHAIKAQQLNHILNLPAQEAVSLNAVGWHAAQLAKYDQARNSCEAALILNRRVGSHDGEASTLDSLGYITRQTARYTEALNYYQQAVALRRSLGYRQDLAGSLDGLGHALVALERHQQAETSWREALDLYSQQGRDTDAARVQRQLDELDAGSPTPEC